MASRWHVRVYVDSYHRHAYYVYTYTHKKYLLLTHYHVPSGDSVTETGR